MARGTNTLSLGAGLNITGQEPIDSRVTVEYESDLTLEDTWNGVGLYKGLTVSVQESGSLYVLMDRDNYTSLSNWKKHGSDISEIDGGEFD